MPNPDLAREIRKARNERLENLLRFQIRAAGLPEPETQVQFHPERKWRADFLFRDRGRRLIAEVDGLVYQGSGGRHQRPAGYEEDCRKLAEAVLAGYFVMRFTGSQVESGEALRFLERWFKGG